MAGPRDVHIDVFVNSIKPLRFDVEPLSNKLPKGPNGEIIFKNHGHAGFNIHFNLKAPPEGYVFPPRHKLSEAVWSQLGEDCCPESAIWEVFTPKRVENNGKTLVVYNENPGPKPQGKFTYTLRITNDGGQTFCDLDPGGDNQNGESLFDVSLSLLFIGGIVVGSLGTLAVEALV